jgi:hypothetical protein
MTEMNEQEMEIHIQTSYANKLERDRISSAKYYQEHKAEILEKKKLYQQDMKELKNIWSIMSLLSTLVNLLSTLATKTRVKP